MENQNLAIIRKPKKRISAIAIAALLIISIGTSLTLLPTTSAHTPPWTIFTNAYIYPTVNPLGVSQTAYVYMWLDKVYDNAALDNDYRFHNYQLTITTPSGKVQKTTFANTNDPTSNQYYLFTPTEVGIYNLNFTFPGQNINDYSHLATSAYVNDTYAPSTASTTITVQDAPIDYPVNSYPLPNEYWTRPIYGENTDWWSISSNWLGGGMPGYGYHATSPNLGGNQEEVYPGDAVGPLTSHIMWTKPIQAGGVVGGNNFPIQGNTYFEGSAYNMRFVNPIILNGKLYYNPPVSFTGVSSGPTTCVDLRTGKLIWSRTDVPPLSFGYIWDHEDPNQHGVYPPILFTNNFARAFDADTGNPLFNVTGVPSGRRALGPMGEQLRYVMANAGNTTNPDWRLGEWNATKLWSFSGLSPVATGVIVGSISMPNATNVRYDWNVSIPWRNTMTTAITVVDARYNDVLLAYNGSLPGKGGQFMGVLSWAPYTYFAVNLNKSKGPLGSILWMQTYDPPPGNLTVLEGGVDYVNRIFIENYREGMQWVGFNLDTGARAWGPTDSQVALDYYGSQGSGSLAGAIAYGKLYSSAYGGILYAYDTSNGKLLWTYGNGGPGNSTNSGFAVPGPYPTFVNAIGNGVIYTLTSEHTVETPIYKGALMRAINATDGKEIWTLSNNNNEFFQASAFAMADGFATTFNAYDNSIYSVGRGPSQTAVLIRNDVIELGSKALIQGTVTDISSGTKQDEQAAHFPNGVPAVSDASMGNWMGYVYQQKPRPKDTVGVNVVISEEDSNGNFYVIGNTTTDSNGVFKFMWQPPIAGEYRIYATFPGSNGYWQSYAETVLGVIEAPTPSPTATPTPTPTPTATPSPTATPIVTPSPAPNPTGGITMETYAAIAAVVIIALVVATAIVLKRRK